MKETGNMASKISLQGKVDSGYISGAVRWLQTLPLEFKLPDFRPELLSDKWSLKV